jgi:hypothetical protein
MRRMNRLLAAAALGGFLAAMAVIAISSATSGGGRSATSTTATSVQGGQTVGVRTTATPSPPRLRPVKLVAAGAYDPQGDGQENNTLAPLAVDGNPATFWKTEHYLHGFHKSGVGLVLDAGRHRALARVQVGTDGAGASAQIELGDSPTGPFHAVSADRPLTATTVFTLRRGSAGRYVVVWITSVPAATGEAHITEVRALAS